MRRLPRSQSADTVLAGHERSVPTAGAVQSSGKHRRSKWPHMFVGALISAGFLSLVLHGVDLRQVLHELRAANLLPLGLAVCAGIISHVVRAYRWRSMFGEKSPVGLRPAFTSMMIGYLANNVLPARLGEVVRIYVLERKAGISKSTSGATIVLERLTDCVVLLGVVMVLSIFVPLPGIIHRNSRIAFIVALALSLVVLFLAFHGTRLLHLVTGRVGWLQGVLEGFIDGLSLLHSGRQTWYMFVCTAVIWGIEAVSVGFVIQAFGLHIPWFAAVLLVVVLSLSFVIPAAPGAVGTYEFFAVLALMPFAVEETQALGVALVLHTIVYLTSTGLGLGCLWAEGLSLRAVVTNVAREEKG